jgi:hypothetical protein
MQSDAISPTPQLPVSPEEIAVLKAENNVLKTENEKLKTENALLKQAAKPSINTGGRTKQFGFENERGT